VQLSPDGKNIQHVIKRGEVTDVFAIRTELHTGFIGIAKDELALDERSRLFCTSRGQNEDK